MMSIKYSNEGAEEIHKYEKIDIWSRSKKQSHILRIGLPDHVGLTTEDTTSIRSLTTS